MDGRAQLQIPDAKGLFAGLFRQCVQGCSARVGAVNAGTCLPYSPN